MVLPPPLSESVIPLKPTDCQGVNMAEQSASAPLMTTGAHADVAAIEEAFVAQRKRVVLHSSEMAVNVYRRLGFIERCILPVYATTTLHGMQPI